MDKQTESRVGGGMFFAGVAVWIGLIAALVEVEVEASGDTTGAEVESSADDTTDTTGGDELVLIECFDTEGVAIPCCRERTGKPVHCCADSFGAPVPCCLDSGGERVPCCDVAPCNG